MRTGGVRQGILCGAAGVVAFAGVAFAKSGDGIGDYSGYTHVRVWPDDAWEARVAREAGARLISEGEAPGAMSEWIVNDGGLAALRESGVTFVVVDEAVERRIEAARERIARANEAIAKLGPRDLSDVWYDDYKDRGQIEARLDALEAEFPDLISEEVVGTSVEGTPIYGYTITSTVGGSPSDKPGLMFNGTIHAREWVSPMTVMYIVENLLEDYGSDPEVTRVMDGVTWYIIPVLNPDGYDYAWDVDRFWRKNRRDNGDGSFGVDLNRNFPVAFAGPSTSSSGFSDVYHGPGPFSEPETQALRDYMMAKPGVEGHIDFHSYSALVLWPTGYQLTNTVPEPDLSNMVDLSFMMSDAIFDTTGYSYIAQNSADLYPAGGVSSDWAYEDAGVYSWTVELRPSSAAQGGFALPAAQILDTAEENFAAVLVLGNALVDGVSYAFPGGLPGEVDAGEPVDLGFSLTTLFGTTPAFTSAEVLWRVGDSGSFTGVAATQDAGGVFNATVPAQACDAGVEYFFEVTTTDGEVFRSPAVDGEVYSFVAKERETLVEDPFEAPSGWSVGDPSDTASTGIWDRGVPQATDSQPGADVTPGSGDECWVTGFSAGASTGANDVDGGATTLFSPAYDLSGYDSATVSYWRWYSNDAGASPSSDVFRVFVSDDGGASWSLLEEVGPAGSQASGGWFEASYAVEDFVSLTDAVRLKFVAEDAGSGSLVEAAIDDLSIVGNGSCCFGDTDGDSLVGLGDLLTVLGAFGGSTDAGASGGDVDGDGLVGLADLLGVLGAFGGECG